MKKIFVPLFLIIALNSFGQIAGYTTINFRYDWIAGRFRALHIPAFNTTPSLQSGQWTAAGAIGLDSILGRPYIYFNSTWNRMAMFSDITGGSSTLQNVFNTEVGGSVLTKTDTISIGLNTVRIISTTLAGNSAIDVLINSTAAASSLQKGVNVSLSGANTNGSQNTYGFYASNTHTGSGSGNFGVLGVANSGSSNYGVWGQTASASGAGVNGLSAGAATGIEADNTSTGPGLTATSITGLSITAQANPSSTNTVVPLMQLARLSSGTAANNIGGSIDLKANTTASTQLNTQLIWQWSNATDASRTSLFQITGVNSAAATTVLTIGGDGKTGGVGITSPTAYLHLPSSTSSIASLRIPTGTAPSSPNEGDTWNDATAHFIRHSLNGTTYAVADRSNHVSTTASNATPTPNADTDDEYTVTALAVGATFGAPTGTPLDGQQLLIRIKDNGTSRSLAWNAAYRASTDLPLPSATTISKTMYLQFSWNATDSKWDLIGLLNNF